MHILGKEVAALQRCKKGGRRKRSKESAISLAYIK